MDKQLAASRQRVCGKMLKTLGGKADETYLQILRLLFDYWFCGDHDQRFETFHSMVHDNNRVDLQKFFSERDIPGKYNEILELFEDGLKEPERKAMFYTIVQWDM